MESLVDALFQKVSGKVVDVLPTNPDGKFTLLNGCTPSDCPISVYISEQFKLFVAPTIDNPEDIFNHTVNELLRAVVMEICHNEGWPMGDCFEYQAYLENIFGVWVCLFKIAVYRTNEEMKIEVDVDNIKAVG